jgi:hypothetical protein
MCASACRTLAIAAALALTACGEPAQYRFGFNATGLRFTPYSASEGIFPSQSVLADPQNPFRTYPLSKDTKWNLQSGGASVAAFYAFATALTGEPTGENQFYAAKNLALVAQSNALADPSQRDAVLQQAINGYQAMLDFFPDAVSFDATGTTSFRLATPAYTAIRALGGKVKGDWLLVTTKTGEEAVRSSSVPAGVDGGR